MYILKGFLFLILFCRFSFIPIQFVCGVIACAAYASCVAKITKK